MIVRLSCEAERNLEAIGDHIAAGSPARALSFVRELRDACLCLADFPTAWPLVPRYEARGVRRRVHGNYLIFYLVEPREIIVIHILHGAMDYEAILFPS